MSAFANYMRDLNNTDYSRDGRAGLMAEQARLATPQELEDMQFAEDSTILDPTEVYGKKQALKANKSSSPSSKLAAANALIKASGANTGQTSALGAGVTSGISAGMSTGNPFVAAAAAVMGTMATASKNRAARQNKREEFRFKAESQALDRTQAALHKLATMKLGV